MSGGVAQRACGGAPCVRQSSLRPRPVGLRARAADSTRMRPHSVRAESLQLESCWRARTRGQSRWPTPFEGVRGRPRRPAPPPRRLRLAGEAGAPPRCRAAALMRRRRKPGRRRRLHHNRASRTKEGGQPSLRPVSCCAAWSAWLTRPRPGGQRLDTAQRRAGTRPAERQSGWRRRTPGRARGASRKVAGAIHPRVFPPCVRVATNQFESL